MKRKPISDVTMSPHTLSTDMADMAATARTSAPMNQIHIGYSLRTIFSVELIPNFSTSSELASCRRLGRPWILCNKKAQGDATKSCTFDNGRRRQLHPRGVSSSNLQA